MKEIEISLLNKRVAGIITLSLLVLSFLAIAIVFAQDNIDAEVTVSPSPIIDCKPDTLTVGDGISWINCIIEFENADVSTIDLGTVFLGLTTSSCSVLADQFTFDIDDADNDGIEDAFVRFSRPSSDASCFGPPLATTNFHLRLTGEAAGIPFEGTDDLLYLKTCADGHVHQMQANSSSNSGRINVLVSPGFTLDNYSPRTFTLNGFFDCRPSGRFVGEMRFFTKGTLVEPTDINFLGMHFIWNKKRPVQISVFFTRLNSCFGDDSGLECVGSGRMYVDREQPFKREMVNLNNLRVEVDKFGTDPGKYVAKIQGGDVFNDKIDVDNLIISKIKLKPSIPKK